MRQGIAFACVTIMLVSTSCNYAVAGSYLIQNSSSAAAPKQSPPPPPPSQIHQVAPPQQVIKVVPQKTQTQQAPAQKLQTFGQPSQSNTINSSTISRSPRGQLYQSVAAPPPKSASPAFTPNSNGTVTVTLSNGTKTFMSPQQAAALYGYQTGSAFPPAGTSGIANTTIQTTTALGRSQTSSVIVPNHAPVNTFPTAYSAPVSLNASHDTGFYDKSYDTQFGKQHLGVDLGASAGTAVSSPVNGTIKGYYRDGTDSFVVIQQSGSSIQHVLGHITCDACKPGQQVTEGQSFGAMVLSNPQEGDHVHWGANYNGIPLSPTNRWGWGQAPATSTPAEAAAKGWFNPLQGHQ